MNRIDFKERYCCLKATPSAQIFRSMSRDHVKIYSHYSSQSWRIDKDASIERSNSNAWKLLKPQWWMDRLSEQPKSNPLSSRFVYLPTLISICTAIIHRQNIEILQESILRTHEQRWSPICRSWLGRGSYKHPSCQSRDRTPPWFSSGPRDRILLLITTNLLAFLYT